jgi:hypothetical protein
MPSVLVVPTQIAPRTVRWLPHAVVATAFVVGFPAVVVWMVVPRGEPALLALSVPLGMLCRYSLQRWAAGCGSACPARATSSSPT